MCGLGGGKQPAPVTPPAPLPEAPAAERQTSVSKDSDAERRRRAAAGQQGTILSGNRGLEGGGMESGTQKTLLGA